MAYSALIAVIDDVFTRREVLLVPRLPYIYRVNQFCDPSRGSLCLSYVLLKNFLSFMKSMSSYMILIPSSPYLQGSHLREQTPVTLAISSHSRFISLCAVRPTSTACI